MVNVSASQQLTRAKRDAITHKSGDSLTSVSRS
jgi:hypothetical protein